MRYRYFVFFYNVIMLTSIGLFLNGCKAAEKKEKSVGAWNYRIVCENNMVIREHILVKTKELRERGPVLLPEGPDNTCRKAKEWPDQKKISLKRHGEWKAFHKETTVIQKGSFHNGKREGKFSFFDLKGQLEAELPHRDGKLNGVAVWYFPGTGEWMMKGDYSDDKRVGLWQTRTDTTGNCIESGQYVDGFKKGTWTECGTLDLSEKSGGKVSVKKQYYKRFEGVYDRGARDGDSTLFHPDGRVFASGAYTDSRECTADREKEREEYKKNLYCLDGFLPEDKCLRELKKSLYFPSFVKYVMAPIKEEREELDEKGCGNRSGTWALYHGNGKVSGRGAYDSKSGLRTGRWIEYYSSGEKLGEGERKHTRKGVWTIYHKSGKILGRYAFDNDFFFTTGEMFLQGKKVAEAVPGKGCVEVEYEMGPRKGEKRLKCKTDPGTVINGLAQYLPEGDIMLLSFVMKNGPWIFYDENGAKVAEGSCQNGKKTGIWKEGSGGSWVTKDHGLMGPTCDTGERELKSKQNILTDRLRKLSNDLRNGSIGRVQYENRTQQIYQELEKVY